MTRMTVFNSPFLLGFDQIERTLDRLSKSSGDSFPPYNIEQLGEDTYRITLAVAGFGPNDVAVTVEENQLLIRGKQADDKDRTYLHRGIAARQFQRAFLLAEGIEVMRADLTNGLLNVDLKRPQAVPTLKKIPVTQGESRPQRIETHTDGNHQRGEGGQ